MSAIQTGEGEGSGHTSKHNILTVPLELLERIAWLAEPSSLRTLRLVNREAAEKVKRVFAAVHFAKVAFLFSCESSLQALLRISRHHVFSRAVREVVLCIEEVPDITDPPDGRSLQARMDIAKKDSKWNQILFAQQVREWQRLWKEQWEFKDRDGHLHMLAVALLSFRRNGNVPALTVTDQEVSGMKAQGTPALEMLLGEKLELSHDADRFVDVTIDALNMTNFALTSLTICFENAAWDMYMVGSCPTGKPWAMSIFQGLKHLHIRTEQPDDDVGQQQADDTASMFESCPNLETLRLDLYKPYFDGPEKTADDYFISEFLTYKLPSLSNLDLRGFPLPVQDLVRFISRHDKLGEATFDECRFHTLKELDDGVSAEKAKHGDLVQKVLRAATGLQALEAPGCTVREWDAPEES